VLDSYFQLVKSDNHFGSFCHAAVPKTEMDWSQVVERISQSFQATIAGDNVEMK
jgi:hypothetical protein